MHDTGCLGLVHWDDPEGWYREEDGRGAGWGRSVYPWQIHVDIWQNQYNIVKLKNLKKSSGSYAQWNITQPLKRIHLNQF